VNRLRNAIGWCAIFGAAGAGMAACGSSPAASSSLNQLRNAVSSAGAAGSASFVESIQTGKQTSTLSGELSATAAYETLSDDGTQLQVELTDNVIYLRGTAPSMASALGLTSQVAQQNAGRWVSVQSSDQPYAGILETLSLPDLLSAFTPASSHSTTYKFVTLKGVRRLAFSGTPSLGTSPGVGANVTLFVPVSGSHNPIGGTSVFVQGQVRTSEAIVFTKWGSAVSVAAPTGARAYSALAG
jgi:hypothetical protein